MSNCFTATKLLLLFFMVVCWLHPLVVLPVEAQRRERNISHELELLKGEIKRQKKRLKNLQKKRAVIEASLDEVSHEVDDITADKNSLQKEVHGLDYRVIRLESGVKKGAEVVRKELANLRRRIVAIYKMNHRSGAFSYLANAGSATDLLRRAHFLARVASADKTRLKELGKAIVSFKAERKQLEEVRTVRKAHLKKTISLKQTLDEKKLRQAKLFNEARAKEEAKEESLAKLQRSADALERILQEIMGGDSLEPRLSKPGPEEPEQPTPSSVDSLDVPKHFRGQGLAKRRGELPLPIDGELVRKFGKQKHEEFSDMVFFKGLEFRGATGAKVHAVSRGMVIFAEALPGYGNVIILDHGKRYYTLYGRLAASLGRVGDLIEQGEALGVVGEPDHKNRNFYFELRIKGKAVNPLKYFSEPPQVAVG